MGLSSSYRNFRSHYLNWFYNQPLPAFCGPNQLHFEGHTLIFTMRVPGFGRQEKNEQHLFLPWFFLVLCVWNKLDTFIFQVLLFCGWTFFFHQFAHDHSFFVPVVVVTHHVESLIVDWLSGYLFLWGCQKREDGTVSSRNPIQKFRFISRNLNPHHITMVPCFLICFIYKPLFNWYLDQLILFIYYSLYHSSHFLCSAMYL